jgi:PAS domain S-box-containing protein
MTFLSRIYATVGHSFTQCRKQKARIPAQNSIPIDALPNVVVILNKEGLILDVNKIGTQLLGYEKNELLRKHLHSLAQSGDEKQSQRTFSRQTAPTPDTGKIQTFVRKDGSLFPANVSVTQYIGQNGEELSLATLTDCTDHQRKLHAAKMYATHLLHDTRGSLGVIQHALADLESCTLNQELQEPISSIRIGTADIATLVNGTLDLEKVLDQARPELSDCYLKEFLKRTLKPSQELAKAHNKRLTLFLDIPQSTYACIAKGALAAVLRNLLSNAIKFTPSECTTPISCEITLTPNTDSEEIRTLSFKVTNRGVGFTEQQKERIFTPFKQASSGISEKYGGSGIGLSQSKEVIEKAGGILDAVSVPNETTTFFGTLPIRITQAPANLSPETAEIKTPKTPNTPRRILLVDDQRIPLRTGSGTLQRRGGHTVETAESVNEALRKAANSTPFDVVITDYDLQEPQDGTDLVERLKKGSSRDIKTILLTGTLDAETIGKAKKAGIDQCVLKGGDPQLLLNTINELFTPPEQS